MFVDWHISSGHGILKNVVGHLIKLRDESEMNGDYLMKGLSKAVLLGFLLFCFGGVQAATVTNNLFVEVLGGPFVGITGSGYFSYDDAGLLGLGDEILTVDDGGLALELTVFGQTFYASNDVDFQWFPELSLFDGIPLYLGFSVSENASVNPTDIQHLGVIGLDLYDLSQEADGSFYAELDVTAVPLPAAVWLFGSGLYGLFMFVGKKVRRC